MRPTSSASVGPALQGERLEGLEASGPRNGIGGSMAIQTRHRNGASHGRAMSRKCCSKACWLRR